MRLVYLTHPEVVIDPAVPVPDWQLSARGVARATALAQRRLFDGWKICASPERKAQQTALILAGGQEFSTHPGLGEIDRSATGYLDMPAHEAQADALFAHPNRSAKGWERAIDAQARTLAALANLQGPDLVVIGHGGVGTLLWCALGGLAIARRYDQPGQGCGWQANFHAGHWQAIGPWQRFEALLPLA